SAPRLLGGRASQVATLPAVSQFSTELSAPGASRRLCRRTTRHLPWRRSGPPSSARSSAMVLPRPHRCRRGSAGHGVRGRRGTRYGRHPAPCPCRPAPAAPPRQPPGRVRPPARAGPHHASAAPRAGLHVMYGAVVLAYPEDGWNLRTTLPTLDRWPAVAQADAVPGTWVRSKGIRASPFRVGRVTRVHRPWL